LKPYWGKPAVRNFREGGRNTRVPEWIHVVRFLSTRRLLRKIPSHHEDAKDTKVVWVTTYPCHGGRNPPANRHFSFSAGERKIMNHFVVSLLVILDCGFRRSPLLRGIALPGQVFGLRVNLSER
jgi:hypothetical protein